MSRETVDGLDALARLHAVQTDYLDTAGRLHRADPEILFGVLRALGVDVQGGGDVEAATRARHEELRRRWLEPVAVAWDGAAAVVPIRPGGVRSRVDCTLVREDGTELSWSTEPGPDSLVVPGPLPTGYHTLRVERGGEARSCTIVAAPARVHAGTDERRWGVFCPLYALHSHKSWGAGDFGDLGALIDWTADLGGGLVATLPMLATVFDGRPWISPYSPASRLFWNEFYLDVEAIPDLRRSESARALLDSADFRREVNALQAAPLVDYGRQVRLKRRVLEHLCEAGESAGVFHSDDFRRFRSEYPEVGPYADFMARADRHGPEVDDWPDAPGDDRDRRYHLYVQYQADAQLRALSDRAEARGLTWYVDYTVGVDPRSYDVLSRPGLFARGASVGCPPDEGFTTGQNWGFPPIHPDRQRDEGYAYMIASLRNHFRYAKALRLDHVMGLHRLYWIPDGRKHGGAYVSYPVEEQYAILSVESHRRGAWVVGEDLGTVPPEVPGAMRRHGIRGLYALQHALSATEGEGFAEVPAAVVAGVNTHDMPTFDGYWDGRDIAQRVDLGLLNEATAAKEEAARPGRREALVAYLRRVGLLDADPSDVGAVFAAVCAFLGHSPSRMAVLSLEDLWLEPDPQNVPGTIDEYPNWRRKLRLALEDFVGHPEIVEALARFDAARRDDRGGS